MNYGGHAGKDAVEVATSAGVAFGTGAAIVGTTATTAAGATVGTTAVSSLLMAAGVSAASVPVIGWVVGGVAAAAAGTIALVLAIRSGKVRKADAVAQAQALGIPDASNVPHFAVQALEKGPEWRAKHAETLMGGITKDLAKGKADKIANRKDVSQLRILTILDLADRAQARGALPAPAAPAVLAEYNPPDYTAYYVAGGLGVAAATAMIVAAVVATSGKRRNGRRR